MKTKVLHFKYFNCINNFKLFVIICVWDKDVDDVVNVYVDDADDAVVVNDVNVDVADDAVDVHDVKVDIADIGKIIPYRFLNAGKLYAV